jgi:hypothetical protein
MMLRIWFFLALTCTTAPALAQPGALCPWFTWGSATNALGGDVSSVVKVAGTFEGTCVFTHGAGDAARSIQIIVGKMDTHACSDASMKVKALGNEAVQCEAIIAGGRKVNTIAGRVREEYFAVTMINVSAATRVEPADGRLSDPYAASLLEKVAEQVAGNLY